MWAFIAALQFLTVLPFPAGWYRGEKDIARSLPFFPIVGLLIGVVMASLDCGLRQLFPGFLSSVFVVISMLFVSGGLHIDGLADTADGFFSSRPRDRMLEIMRDSRTGPMGVAAVVCVISLKIAALASVQTDVRWWVLLMMPLAGRSALIINLAVLPYVRAEGGLGSIFIKNRSQLHTLWALVFLLLTGWLVGGYLGIAVGVTAFAASLLFALYTYRKIGGLTGDTLGASCELVEIVPALAAVAWIGGVS